MEKLKANSLTNKLGEETLKVVIYLKSEYKVRKL